MIFRWFKIRLLAKVGVEKLRMRTYAEQPTDDCQVFLEIKKSLKKLDLSIA